jgi:uncharacterized protein YacL
MEALLTKIGAIFAALLPAALGSAVSAFQDKEKTLAMTRFEAFCTFAFGIIVGYAVGHAIIEFFNTPKVVINPDGFIAFSIQFTLGVCGMSALNETKAQIPKWYDAAREKILGK